MRGRRKAVTIEVPVDEGGNPIPPIERLAVRVTEAAHLLSISRAAVYRLLSSGELEASKSGQKTLIEVASIRAFLERNRVLIASVPHPDS